MTWQSFNRLVGVCIYARFRSRKLHLMPVRTGVAVIYILPHHKKKKKKKERKHKRQPTLYTAKKRIIYKTSMQIKHWNKLVGPRQLLIINMNRNLTSPLLHFQRAPACRSYSLSTFFRFTQPVGMARLPGKKKSIKIARTRHDIISARVGGDISGLNLWRVQNVQFFFFGW